jgi:hypothetical protein
LKNRPGLGEIAVRELLADNLLKFNYFLNDIRRRNVKSYMKMPVPPINDPSYETFIETLARHEIDVDEYRIVYENSSIPPNNTLSLMALEIFQTNASFVTEYKKYRSQLHCIVQEHVENRNIKETEDGQFVVVKKDAFTHQFHEIGNFISPSRQDKTRGKFYLLRHMTENLLNEIFHPYMSLDSTTTVRADIGCLPIENEGNVQNRFLKEIPINQQQLRIGPSDGNSFFSFSKIIIRITLCRNTCCGESLFRNHPHLITNDG